jgi:predicted ArsR family transcriptional regulator
MTVPAYSAISSYSRVRLLRLLQLGAKRTISELCAATGLHANTVREHLQRLIEGGYIVAETEHRTTRGRPRVLYSAAGMGAVSSPVARRKAREAAKRGDLMRRVMPWAESGELPTAALHQLDALTEDLTAAGFDPLIDETELTVDLTPCLHATALAEHRQALCAAHLGLMQSVVNEAGGPLSVDRIQESCDPTKCVVLLSTRQVANR